VITFKKKIFSLQIFFTLLLFLLSLLFSVYFNLFNPDFHHPFIMFANAYDLISGYKPYKEIFIAYGIMTTLIHSFSLLTFGNYIISPFIITAIFYALTFPVFFRILKNLNFSDNISLLSTILIFLIHPSIILPWSNYIAYSFLLLGILFISKEELTQKDFFLTGVFWGLACLSRQTYFLSIIAIFIFFFVLILFYERKLHKLKNTIIVFFSFLTVLIIFFLYLILNDTFLYWELITFEYYKIFLFENNKYLNINLKSLLDFLFNTLRPLISNFFFSIKNLDIRFFIYGLIFLLNIFLCIYLLIKKKNLKILFLSYLSLLLLSESLRLVEIFRLSTGSILGIIPVLFFLKKNYYLKHILGIFIFLLLFTWYGGKHNYSYINYFNNKNLKDDLIENDVFKFMKLPKNVSEFYNTLQTEIEIMKDQYVLNKNFNYTSLPLIGYFSKTKRYQLASYYIRNEEVFYTKRNDLDKKKIYEEFDDIVIFYASNNLEIKNDNLNNFNIYKTISYPFENLKYLHILLSKKVKKIE